jgi:2-polyprenyl-3-methyl-5-hydroxy-6-metoxy-1,4-benzoquinol methylase
MESKMRKHSPISRTLWQNSQKQTLERWKEKKLSAERKKDEEAYLPLLLKYAENLPQDGAVLEIGCGPVCLSQSLPLENKTFLDPLLDDFRRMYPGELREGEYLATMAEKIPKDNNSYDLIICLNTISYSLHPELVMNEMERLLRPGGKLILAIRIHSHLESRLHYWTTHCMPVLYYGVQPNFYSLAGIRKTLARHFTIEDAIVSYSRFTWLPFLRREERLFVCTNSADKTSSL